MGLMGNIANGQIFKLNIGLMIVSTLIMALMTKLRKLFKKSKKRAIIYAIFILVTFALTGLLSSSKVFNDTPLNSFYGFQFIFLCLGILHIYILQKYFSDLSEDRSAFFPEFLFTVAYLCLGLIAFTQVINKFRSPFSFLFMASTFLFLLPMLVYKLYEFAMSIPVPIYKSWRFPINKDIKDPTSEELANPRVISFEFKKKRGQGDITNFRVKAPQAMEFGKLFYFFIIDYNERHPEGHIETLEEKTEQPSEWVFYFKPNWWSPLKHINFTQTVAANNIKEDTVIICRRVDET
jgi:Type VI secretion system, TssN